jgi:hypothetical protein
VGPLSLLTGAHTVKVWRSRDGLRLSVPLRAGEEGLFVSPGRAWAWDFGSLTAYDLGRFPPIAADFFAALGGGGPVVEATLRRVLAGVADTTRVRVAGTRWIGGRPAYRLLVVPRQKGTLIGAVEIDIDAAQRLPLALFVAARGSDQPAISIQFTSVRFGAIDPSTFVFQPPPDVRVQRVGLGTNGNSPFPAVRSVRTFGHAWTTVVALEMPPIAGGALGGVGGLLSSSLLQLGGPLFSIRVADRPDHAWVLIGSVPMERMQAVEGQLP